MKKNQVNMILVDQANRKRKILSYGCLIFIIFVLGISFFVLFINKSQTQYVEYREKSELDYKVYLKNNEFFEGDYLVSDNEYIASLIDYIRAYFKYDLDVEKKDINYQYSYRIDADIVVKERDSQKNLYFHTDNLVKETLKHSNSTSMVNISEALDIDYNKYNDLIKKFVTLYGLDNVESSLNINMYVSVVGDCEDIADADTESVISLSIPLTTNTVGIDMKYDLVDADQVKLMICNEDNSSSFIYLIVCISFLLSAGCLTAKTVIYVLDTRTAETIYERELKKILNNYKSYIQKINNEFDLKNYQVLKVDTFTDMLEIRDTVNEPILMIENKEKNSSYFVIPSKTKLLYIYSLNVSDIQSQLEEKMNEDF